MKSRFFGIVAVSAMLLMGSAVANAQPGGPGMGPGGQRPDPAKMAQMRADRMKETLNLTEEQYNKVLEVYKAESEQMEKMMANGPQGDREANREQMDKMRKEQDEQIKAILTEEQYKTWSSDENNRRGPGGPGGPDGPRGPRPQNN